MGRIPKAAIGLGAAVVVAAIVVSGGSPADPRTPPALPGYPAPFLGVAVIGSGGVAASIDAYGDIVDLRDPGPAGRGLIENPSDRQAVGSVPADTGIVPWVASGTGAPAPLWRSRRIRQSYLPGTNVLRTVALLGRVRVALTDAARGRTISRRIAVSGPSGEPLRLRLRLNLARAGACRPSEAGREVASTGTRVIDWLGRGRIRAGVVCHFGAAPPPPSAGAVIAAAAGADRSWIARARALGPRAPAWANRMRDRSLLVLRALTDRRTGAMAAGIREGWAYVWPRDAAAASIALGEAGYRREARRVAGFLEALDVAGGARFRGDRSPVDDGRRPQGDAAGGGRAAAIAAGRPAPGVPAAPWRDRADYGERSGDSGNYLGNAIAAGVPATRIRSLFGTPAGLVRRAGDPSSGIDSAASWALRPFSRPALAGEVRRSLRVLVAGSGRFGIEPAQDWPGDDPWSAPTAWVAWGLAALGERSRSTMLLADLRRSATGAGALPERVGAGTGIPRSTTPLGWSHAFASLALEELFPRR